MSDGYGVWSVEKSDGNSRVGAGDHRAAGEMNEGQAAEGQPLVGQ